MLHSIHLYHAEVEKIIHYGGSTKERAIRTAFFNLLNDYARQRRLMLVAELTVKAPNGKVVLRVDRGSIPGEEAQRPCHCPKIQHLSFCQLQRSGD